MIKTQTYNLHDLIKISIIYFGQSGQIFVQKRLGEFRSDKIDASQIQVFLNIPIEELPVKIKLQIDQGKNVIYDRSRRRLGKWAAYILEAESGETIIVFWGNRYSVKYLFYNYLEPIINHHLMKMDACLVHASSFSIGGKGYLVNAFPSSGKTTVLLKMLERGADYLADELVIINVDGKIYSYPTPVSLFDYNFTERLNSKMPVKERALIWLSKFVRVLSNSRLKVPIIIDPVKLLNGGDILTSCAIDTSYVIGCEDQPDKSINQCLLSINMMQYRYFISLLRNQSEHTRNMSIHEYCSNMESVINVICSNTTTIPVNSATECIALLGK